MTVRLRRTFALSAALTFHLPLAACADRALDDARVACTSVLQAMYRPVNENEPVTFTPVKNAAPDRDKFEFVWKQSEIANLLFTLSAAELVRGTKPSPDGNYSMIIERAGAERQYVCRGSLGARSLHGVWVRQTRGSGEVNDIKVTQYPVSF